jgi:L-rhamnono-1,4-lactonase
MASIPIIDSHIHLYPESELETLAWCTPESPLAKQHSLEEYKAAIASSPAPVKGFIFLETDRKVDLEAGAKDGSGWKYPLMEVEWVKRIALGQPRDGEGHTKEDAGLCAAYIPWAPLPSGPQAMEKYIELVKEAAGDSYSKVRGFRYLLQDKPDKTCLSDDFIESLKLMGRQGLVFDVGVNQHDRGRIQLEETVEMIDRAHEGVPEDEKVKFILSKCICLPRGI